MEINLTRNQAKNIISEVIDDYLEHLHESNSTGQSQYQYRKIQASANKLNL